MQYKTGLTSVLVLAAGVSAQSNSCSVSSGATATAQADLDKYSSCKKLSGDLVISGKQLSNGALANVEEIDGSLSIIDSSTIVNFSADKLRKIKDSLKLMDLPSLEAASFGALEEVSMVQFQALPVVNNIVTSKLKTANDIVISNTNLRSIKEFTSLGAVQKFDVNNNRYLRSIDASIKTVGNSLALSSNDKIENITFNNLVWANNITLYSVRDISMKALVAVNHSLAVESCPMKSLELSNLTKVGGDVTFANNEHLTKIDLSKVEEITGALVIADNEKLDRINGFKSVKSIGGSLTVNGSFSELDLSELGSVRGGVSVNSKAKNFSCNPLDDLHKAKNIQGKYQCSTGKSDDSSSSSGSSGSSSGGKGDSGSSTKGSPATSKDIGAHLTPGASLMGAFAAVAIALL
ncbi:ABL063Cp [Eremothecium gossypii ATCC 10895]|uniref:ABL063Cp n=1 Tax=Eremothecium gossypii (strain ATCC 10895 / CBS 109.51 / FGSC 9923 / NRRL Y-1056) TaxID=284811 RepID=Q75DT6_EREGS|nr:ABL063Cp [Eremothecium gossypii ATCC 10895]AAS50708.2 ABL063Cp [Eremothecium gossypii ATCC 10895]